ncbi:MAG: DUF1854 domain-containing protein [Planctomycetota bacterium]|nr:DUF1854 domain-containing protein [Planctomycetota bacterium]
MQTQAPSVTDTTTLRYLDAAKLRLVRRGATLCVTIEGEVTHLGASFARLFPLSEPDRYFTLRGGDGKEVGLLVDARGLDAASLAGLAEELRRRYVVPQIQRVHGVKERFGTLEWSVTTDRGDCRFTTRGLRESVMQPTPGRYLLTDVDGNRYDVADYDALDATSRGFITRYT